MNTVIVERAKALMTKALDRSLPEADRAVRIAELLELLNPIIGD